MQILQKKCKTVMFRKRRRRKNGHLHNSLFVQIMKIASIIICGAVHGCSGS